ncbi:MAG: hypothetical protein DRP09_21950 [Candidatus Thorarchaeota archaeon]|nr:MAG: hypothetical protein DRP09_21950 [Candidatus Thorarchaeota archaeon]
MMKLRRRQSGFTFVEILVVVVIIMILVTGIIVVASSVRKKAQIKATKGIIQNLTSALQEYKNYHEADFADFDTNNNTWIETLYTGPKCKKILDNIPNDLKADEFEKDGNNNPVPGRNEIVDTIYDSWGNAIRVVSNGVGNFPTIRSAGPDKLFGNADDITSDKL